MDDDLRATGGVRVEWARACDSWRRARLPRGMASAFKGAVARRGGARDDGLSHRLLARIARDRPLARAARYVAFACSASASMKGRGLSARHLRIVPPAVKACVTSESLP